MNPKLDLLQPYPFERLRALLADVAPATQLPHINLSIGEPKHPTPQFIRNMLTEHLPGLASYPLTIGTVPLRAAIHDWLTRRFKLDAIDAYTQIIPTLGSREALFSIGQTVLDGGKPDAVVVCPNPFYQIYEGAALLGGARAHFINTLPEHGFRMEWSQLPDEVWARTQLVYTCSPGNPTGAVMSLDEWEELFALSDRHGFVIAADECYSEIYFEEGAPPLGSLEAAQRLGRTGLTNLVAFGSLSKRSNVPGMRSGFAAGDAALIKAFTLYRTYHGGAMSPPVQAASEAAWRDEAHVIENRRLYREKFSAFYAIVNPVLPLTMPQASFYFWAKVPVADEEFARRLLRQAHVTVLPGSYLARAANGVNPGSGFVRIALVAPLDECVDAARRIVDVVPTLH